MELTGNDNGLRLPPNFLDTWCTLGTEAADGEEFGPSLITTSKIQSDVGKALSRIGVEHSEEFIIGIQGAKLLSIDMAVPSQMIAIEVDGPSHFIHNMDNWSPQEVFKNPSGHSEFDWNSVTQEMNGSTARKDRLLQKMGWNVFHIPFWEWYNLNGNPQAENEYLHKLLAG